VPSASPTKSSTDPTIVAIPGFFATMGLEYLWSKRRARRDGPRAADYERNDTITSLTMGVGSLLAPIVLSKLLAPFTPGEGRYGRHLVATAAGAVAVTSAADLLARIDTRSETTGATETGGAVASGRTEAIDMGGDPSGVSSVSPNRQARRRVGEIARKVARVGGVVSVLTGGLAIASTWTTRTGTERLWNRRLLPDLGNGPLALAAAVAGWDFIYYWNHRFMHEARYMWAIHVVHHSSEHYNLSTALRQPVLDVLGTFVPYGLLCLFGIRPEMVLQARAINLIYQYWIHTDAIRTIGPLEEVLNTPSHHRVHHGTNRQYLDRNHGSILIFWDKVFGTFEPEDEEVVYGLTKNIDTFNPLRVATHEHLDILHDVAASDNWHDRISYVVRGPGWAYAKHAEAVK